MQFARAGTGFEGKEFGQQAVEFYRFIQHGEVTRFFQHNLLRHGRVGCLFTGSGDRLVALPKGFRCIGTSGNAPLAAIADTERKFYGIQFHPEVVHTPRGSDLIRAFLFDVAGCEPNWTPGSFIDDAIAQIAATVANEGTDTRTSKQIREELRSIGGTLSLGSDTDSTTMSASALAEFSPRLFELMSDVAQHPAFPETEVKLAQENTIQQIRA